MHKMISFSRKQIEKSVPTLPEIFRPFTRNTLIFLFGLIAYAQKPPLNTQVDVSSVALALWSYPYGNLDFVTYSGVKVTFSSCSISSFNNR